MVTKVEEHADLLVRRTSGVFYKDCGEKIKAAIKDPSSADKNLRYFIKKSGFQILNIPSLGARDVLVVPAKQQVARCDICQRANRKLVYTAPELYPVPVKSPWHHIGIDFVGPILESISGNLYILTVG
eukprot:Em0017g269a